MRGDLGFLLPTTSRVRVSESRARTEVALSLGLFRGLCGNRGSWLLSGMPLVGCKPGADLSIPDQAEDLGYLSVWLGISVLGPEYCYLSNSFPVVALEKMQILSTAGLNGTDR